MTNLAYVETWYTESGKTPPSLKKYNFKSILISQVDIIS